MNNTHWFIKNYNDKDLKICFPNDDYSLINTFFHLNSIDKLIEIKNLLGNINKDMKPFDIPFEYGVLNVSHDKVILSLNIFEDIDDCYIYGNDLFIFLSDYIQEYEKMMSEEVGLSK